jgi:protein-S-isoprenylcysteine O-methyltransferase Ste14
MKTPADSKLVLSIKAVLMMLLGAGGMLALFFLPAGTWDYWQAWVFLGIVLIPTFALLIILLFKDPETLQRRMKHKESNAGQDKIIKLSGVVLSLAFLLPGFDKRWGWSHLPVWLVIAADVVCLAGYLVFMLVLRENRFASRVVEVEQGQKVISSGPYAVVRHPMYVGMLLLYLACPLALGSAWAFIPALLMFPVLVLRIRGEEKILMAELPGYMEYVKKVKFRLIPGAW